MTLMFDKKSVEETTHPLARILRHIFYKNKITLDGFSSLYAQHGNRQGLSAVTANTNRNNHRKALVLPDTLTFALFQYIINNVLHATIVEYSVTILDEKTGERITYRDTDPIE